MIDTIHVVYLMISNRQNKSPIVIQITRSVVESLDLPAIPRSDPLQSEEEGTPGGVRETCKRYMSLRTAGQVTGSTEFTV